MYYRSELMKLCFHCQKTKKKNLSLISRERIYSLDNISNDWYHLKFLESFLSISRVKVMVKY